MKTLFVSILGLTVAFWTWPAQGEQVATYTIEDAIRIGLERSIPLREARRNVEIAHEQVRDVRAQVYPSLDVNANYTRIGDLPEFPGSGPIGTKDTYAANVEAGQLLYSGGAVKAALRIAADFIEASDAERARVESDLVRRITRDFYAVLFFEQARDVAQASVAQLEAFEKQSRLRYEAQALAEFDWLSARVALANERPNLIEAENRLAVAKRAFRDLIYLDDDAFELEGDLDIALPELDRETLIQHGLANRPELRAVEIAIIINDAERDVNRAENLPELRAFAQYGGSEPGQRDFLSDDWEWEWSAGLRATWSLYDGGARRARDRILRLEREQEEDQQSELIRAVALEIDVAWRNLEEARERLASTSEAVALAKRALEIATVRFDQGLATYLDVTDSNLALSRARLNRSSALLDCRQSLADLHFAAAWPATQEKQEP
jgi:outer membrane protein